MRLPEFSCGLAFLAIMFALQTDTARTVAATPVKNAQGTNAERNTRLRAKGFRADDPALKSKLKTLANKHAHDLRNKPRRHAKSIRSIRVSMIALGTPIRSGIKTPTSSSGPPHLTNAWVFGGRVTLVGMGLNSIPNGSTVPVTLHLGNCGISNTTGEYGGSGSYAAPLGVKGIVYPYAIVPMDGTNGSATATASVGGANTNAVTLPYRQTILNGFDYGVSVAILDTPPQLDNLGVNSSGFVQGTTVLYSTSAPRISTTPFVASSAGSGTDILGRGIFLENGYTASAKILWASSYMDNPDFTSPCDQDRCASISSQPANGRLETEVQWSYQAGESISYAIEWDFTGPAFFRPISTMPKQGPCTDEQ
jgi:hypothetical protein